MHPEDLAAARFKEIRQARERIEKAEAARVQSFARLEELRNKIGAAEHRDRAALGEALVDGKAQPASEAAKLKAELEEEARKAEALALAVEATRAQIPKLVEAHRSSWRAQAMRGLSRAKVRYESTISELAAARAGLNDAATLVAWLDSGALEDAANDALGGRAGSDARGHAISFGRTLEALRDDCERLANHPATRGDPIPEPRLELAWTDRR